MTERTRRGKALVAFAYLLAFTVGPWLMVLATLYEPRLGGPDLEVPIQGDFLAGNLAVHTHDAEIVGLEEGRIWARAIGLSPRIEVAWRGSGSHHKNFRIVLENANLEKGRVTLSDGASEVSRKGTTITVEGWLKLGPLSVEVSVPDATALAGKFALLGCSRSNRLMTNILADLARERPLFVLHMGDISHGHNFELETMRTCFDDLGIPVFVAPGNHDISPVPQDSLNAFHRYLNVAPTAFSVAGRRFVLLDVADYPIRGPEIDWLEGEVAAVGSGPLWVFMHRSPVDPHNLNLELGPREGTDALKAALAPADHARVYAAHLGGYFSGTFAGHPFILSAGGGEVEKVWGHPKPYHHLLVSIADASEQRIEYAPPSTFDAVWSHLEVDAPVFFRRPWLGFLGSAFALLVLRRILRRGKAQASIPE